MSGADAVDPRVRRRIGYAAACLTLAVFGGFALTVNVPRAVDFPGVSGGFKSDEATYYLMGRSLAIDGDLEYRYEDLARAYAEYPSGPSGLFLKKGQTIRGMHLSAAVPFLDIVGGPDPGERWRLYYGKSFIYPAAAAPFVWLFGTNGFLFLNALMLTAALTAGYFYLSARSRPLPALLVAAAFTFATVVPVYFTLMLPELFNFALGVLAYFFWLHKVGREPGVRTSGLVYGPVSDVIAAAIIGAATFSKITNVLLLVPMVAWLAWRRQWRAAIGVALAWAIVVAALFAINTASSGDWNYQGGERATFYERYAFQDPQSGFEVGTLMGRNEALGDVVFDAGMFWQNLLANMRYTVVGRYSGLIAYFFPALVAIVWMVVAPRRRGAWQWLILAALVAHMFVFIITQPYTYYGSGGSVGNRYFMGAYGMSLFLLPPLRGLAAPLLMWVVGAAFMAKLIMNPFYTALFPYKHAMSGPFRWLPVELTNVNDLPIMTNQDQMKFWYGDHEPGVDYGFQIYYLDENSYLRELDKSFWVRGESTAEMLIKTDQPFRELELTFRAGPVPAWARVSFGGRSQDIVLPSAGASHTVRFNLGRGFLYRKDADQEPKHVWTLSITAGKGFVPKLLDAGSSDIRYLGVSVTPKIFK